MNTNKERCSAASPGHVVRDSPYRRPRRTLDYGTVALQQIKVVPLRERVRARRRRRGAWEWELTPGPVLRRRQRVAAVVTWGLLCVLVFIIAYLLAPWLSLVVP